MFRAIWIWVWSPVWEVRIVSTTTGKDIPGRCVYKGTYWKARKQFKKTKGKYGNMIRLQAVIRADWRMNETPDIPKEMWPPEEVEEFKEKLREAVPIVEGNHPRDLPVEPHDIGTSNARQSEFMEKHQDEPNVYQGEDHGDHECDRLGPMEFDKALGYLPTCSICEAPQYSDVGIG